MNKCNTCQSSRVLWYNLDLSTNDKSGLADKGAFNWCRSCFTTASAALLVEMEQNSGFACARDYRLALVNSLRSGCYDRPDGGQPREHVGAFTWTQGENEGGTWSEYEDAVSQAERICLTSEGVKLHQMHARHSSLIESMDMVWDAHNRLVPKGQVSRVVIDEAYAEET